MKEKIKQILKRNVITRKLYNTWEKEKIENDIKGKINHLQNAGNDFIIDVNKALATGNEIFFLDYGSLLGIVREGGIIKHDSDIDFGVSVINQDTIKQIRRCLSEHGYKLLSINHVDDSIVAQDTFGKNGIEFDIYYHYIENENGHVYMIYRDPSKSYSDNEWDVVVATTKAIHETIDFPFNKSTVRIPKYYLQHIENRYGPNWRVPDKTYVYWKGNSTSFCNLKGSMEVIR